MLTHNDFILLLLKCINKYLEAFLVLISNTVNIDR